MKFGILGAGFIAAVMADTLCRMAQQGETGAELYAVAARDIGRARAFAAEHNVPKAYGSYEEMLRDPAVEVVYIATPHSLHYRHIKLCADHGKHILCEKPFTVSARQAEDPALRPGPGRAGHRGHLDPVPADAAHHPGGGGIRKDRRAPAADRQSGL